MFNLVEYLTAGGFERSLRERNELEKNNKVLRNQIGKYIIDSCYTFDAGYETGIFHTDYRYVIIVERYKNENEMKKGHKKWIKYCEKNPKKLYSVQYEEKISIKGWNE